MPGWATSSCHQKSRPAFIGMSWPVRLSTITRCTISCARSTASSVIFFSSTILLFIQPPSPVISTFDCASSIRECSASVEKPP